ncbi:MAG: hypothetical protein LBT53_03650 [Puniceicoccales bacterium]|nr:hypothetical protein [Puniceicoccales bacterium]
MLTSRSRPVALARGNVLRNPPLAHADAVRVAVHLPVAVSAGSAVRHR